MKILQLCNKMPWPAKDGYAIAVLNLARAFAQKGNEVTVLAMNTSRHFVQLSSIPKDEISGIRLHTAEVDNRITIGGALMGLLRNRSYNVSRFISASYQKELISLLKENTYDIIQLEGLYLTPYIPVIRQYSKAKVVLRAHNVEHVIWQRNAEQEKGFLKRTYLRILTRQLKHYEKEILNKYDLLVPVSQADAEQLNALGNTAPVHVCPVSFDEQRLRPEGSARPGTIFFLGSLDWMPNVEGLLWFMDKVWKKVTARFPSLELHIAGRNMPDRIKELKEKNIIIAGEVPDAQAFMRDKQVMIVPLFAGSGMRVKIVEGMALGKIVLSTDVGAEGITCTNNENILLADTAEEFIAQLGSVMEDSQKAERIAAAAASFARSYYSTGATVTGLLEFYRKQTS